MSIKNNDNNYLLNGITSEVSEGEHFFFHQETEKGKPPIVLTAYHQERRKDRETNKKKGNMRKKFIVVSNVDGNAVGRATSGVEKPRVVLLYTQEMGHVDQADKSILYNRYPFKTISWKLKVINWLRSMVQNNIIAIMRHDEAKIQGPAAPGKKRKLIDGDTIVKELMDAVLAKYGVKTSHNLLSIKTRGRCVMCSYRTYHFCEDCSEYVHSKACFASRHAPKKRGRKTVVVRCNVHLLPLEIVYLTLICFIALKCFRW